ncbi:MAG: 50S ribosomal protein L25, partial [Candidatus Acidiferrales bacterium]
GKDSAVPVSVNAKQVASILRSEAGHNTIFKLKIAGKGENTVLLKDWQVDPVKGHLLHVDLLRIAMDVKMRVNVPVHTFGDPEGVKLQGGIFETVTREVEIECLPTDIPGEFRVDVSHLTIGKHLRAGDLPIDAAKHTLLTDAQRVIAHVVALRAEEEVVPEAAAVTAEGVAAAPAEPEVIKKGKKEVEGEEGAEPEKAEKGEKKK